MTVSDSQTLQREGRDNGTPNCSVDLLLTSSMIAGYLPKLLGHISPVTGAKLSAPVTGKIGNKKINC